MRHISKLSLLLAGIAFATLLLARNIDFRVYWYGVNGFFSGLRPAYGPGSGLGFPMHYRYAPATYLLLWPLTQLSLHAAGLLWLFGAWVAAIAAIRLMVRAAGLRFTCRGVLAAGACMSAYVFLSLRSGNVQTYIIAMILAALVWSETRPRLAAALLALAITFKVWPLFFIPWLLRPKRRPVLAWLLPAALLLWLAPLLVWSPSRYVELIKQWARLEFQSATADTELWYFPGQSLRGLLLRSFTANEPWIEGFPKIQILSLHPTHVVRAWQAAALITYLCVCVAMLRCRPQERHIWDSAGFALFTLLQPCQEQHDLARPGGIGGSRPVLRNQRPPMPAGDSGPPALPRSLLPGAARSGDAVQTMAPPVAGVGPRLLCCAAADGGVAAVDATAPGTPAWFRNPMTARVLHRAPIPPSPST